MNTPAISLRAATPADACALLNIYATYVRQTAITFEYDVPSQQEFSDRISRFLTGYPYLVAESEGEILGYAYASPFHVRKAYSWCAEVTIYVDSRHKGMGIGRLLYRKLEEVLAVQGVLNLYACIAQPKTEDEHLTNDSANFHQHFGYRLVGTFDRCGYKFGRWYDMIWMEKQIAPHLDDQPSIKTFDQVRHLFPEL